jgi:hypothetical protein
LYSSASSAENQVSASIQAAVVVDLVAAVLVVGEAAAAITPADFQ